MNDIKDNGCVGAVMVVGGGIGGIQASLDLVNAGFKVYMVDESTAIGGIMAQLDKTFPTNDCSMCIISPKLVEVGKDRNIEIITNAKVESIQGEAGNFRINILVNPRFIDLEKCTGCGECAKNCPVSLPNEFNQYLDSRKAIYKLYPQAIPNAFAINKLGIAPCMNACPSHVHVQGYVALIGEGKFKEALKLIKMENPIPSVCGRICHHPCETECNRSDIDEPVAINPLKRFVADYVRMNYSGDEIEKPVIDPNKPKVAIVGAGPAGLTAGRDLVMRGYPVTIFEALPLPGGMLLAGVPKYRLPKDILQYDIDEILKLGIELKTGCRIGRDMSLDDLRKDGYEASFLALGLWKGRSLNIEGIDLNGVSQGIDFLRRINLGEDIQLPKRVLVIGGGNVAIDVALTALRQGAKEVQLACLECREEMPAHEWEILDALDEGVILNVSWGPKRILSENGKVKGIELVCCTSVFDKDGRFKPCFNENETKTIETDMVMLAIGQASDLSGFEQEQEISTGPGSTIQVDPITLETGKEGVFAGGDVVLGPKSAIEAIAQGHRAAISIDRYLQGTDMRSDREEEKKEPVSAPEKAVEKLARVKTPKRSVSERSGTFKEIELTISEEEAIAEAKRCLNCAICSLCLQCVESCLANAVLHDMIPIKREIEVGSVVLALGLKTFDAAIKGQYGYGRLKNVVTSIEFERILSASGPFQGEVVRPSDGSHPRMLAWIQCVGSRDATCGNNYCSSVCCMYATKEAIIAREHDSNIEPTIFYMDIRAFGKDFDLYYERARNEHGVRYVRSMVSNLVEKPENKNIIIRYVEENGIYAEEEFEMVILSVGMVPSDSSVALCERLGINLEGHGFCETSTFEPLKTSRDGIYVCGAFQSPKDIPETVAQASGAAAYAGGILSPARGQLIEEVVYPEERDVLNEDPRIGVFVCNCGINIGGFVDVPAVKDYASTLPGVAYAGENLYTCSQDTQQKIRVAIAENNLNRVVVASCSPRTHESLFRSTIKDAGLNKYLFEMANIRDQCSWVHQHNKDKATLKAKDLVRMAVANACLLSPLKELTLDVNHKGLVIGGGLAGMNAALRLAEQGFGVTLVEKEAELGGNLRNLYYTLKEANVQNYLKELIDRVESNPLITILKNAEIDSYEGYKGSFVTSLLVGPAMRAVKIEHGITIVATGAEESKPSEYLYGEDEAVLTQMELEKQIVMDEGSIKAKNEFVMIQCVGSRDEKRPYCSRICCSLAIKNALKIKEINPKARVYILYRDIRTYGLIEEYYTLARGKGVMFIRYDLEKKPEVNKDGNGLSVLAYDPVIKMKLKLKPDLLILSSALIPRENEELSTLLKINRTRDNFYLEAHMKLRPVDFATEGIYMCGMGHHPKLIEETISQSAAAAARAVTVLSRDKLQADGVVASVDPEICAACLTCVRVCPFGVPFINNDGAAEINPALCQGCGTCVSDCPGKAIVLHHYRDEQIIAKCENLMETVI